MLHRATAEKLYKACGFQAKPGVVHRMLGLPSRDLLEFVAIPGSVPQSLLVHDDIAFERKMFRARRAVQLISFLPFVRAVAVCNSLGFQMVHEESDVDLFIVTARGRVWSARWWVTGVLALLRMRPGESMRDPICVSFFVDESIAHLSGVRIENDIYFEFWLRSLMPMLGDHPLFNLGAKTAPEFRVKTRISRIREILAGLISENFVRRQQMNILPDEVRDRALHNDTTVVLSDTIIKLHQNDRRVELRDAVYN